MEERRHWRIVVAAFIFIFFQGGLVGCLGLLVPAVASYFNTGRTEAGMVISLTMFFTNAAAPLVAIFIRRKGHTLVGFIGMCLSLSGFVMSGLSLMVVPRLGLLYLSISLAVGLGSSCLAFVSADVIRVYFSKNFGIAIGIGTSGAGIGTIVLSPLLQLAIDALGLAVALILMGSAYLLCLLSVFLIHREGKVRPAVVSKEDRSKPLLTIYGEIFSSVDIVLLLVYLVLVALTNTAGLTFNADRAIHFNIRPLHTTLLLAMTGSFNSLGKIVMGRMVDLLRAHIFPLTMAVMLVHVVMFAVSDLLPSWAGQMFCFAQFGFTFGCYYSSSAFLVKTLGGDNATECTGLWLLTWGLASLAGPGIVGPFFDAYKSYRLGYLVVGCLAGCGVMLLPIVKIANNKKRIAR